MTTAAQEQPQGQGPLTARRRVVFTQASGLHLRLADQLVQRAAAFQADIWLEGPEGRADGKSILDLMALAAACGTTLEIEARGPDAEGAVAALAALIGAGFEASEEGAGARRPRAASCPETTRMPPPLPRAGLGPGRVNDRHDRHRFTGLRRESLLRRMTPCRSP